MWSEYGLFATCLSTERIIIPKLWEYRGKCILFIFNDDVATITQLLAKHNIQYRNIGKQSRLFAPIDFMLTDRLKNCGYSKMSEDVATL